MFHDVPQYAVDFLIVIIYLESASTLLCTIPEEKQP